MTPCWIPRLAATPADLDRVHVWNEMMQLRVDADTVGAQRGAAVAFHLEFICLELRHSARVAR